MTEEKYKELKFQDSKINKTHINKDNLDKDCEEPQIDEEKFRLNEKEKNLPKINRENLDKDYEEPQIDEERFKNKFTIDKTEGESLNSYLIPRCPHQNSLKKEVCNCPINCDCKQNIDCKEIKNIEHPIKEIIDVDREKNTETIDVKKQNDNEGVWDITKNIISGGIEKAKDMFSKF